MPAQSRKPNGELQTFRTLASFRLHLLARLSERFYEQFYQHQFGLSLLECRLIGITGGHGHVTFKRTCEEANLDKSHASRLVNRLIRRRLLQKVSNPADQRSVMLALTSAGRACHQQLHSCATRLSGEWLSVLGADASRAFQESLVKLTDKMRAMGDAEAGRRNSPAGRRAGQRTSKDGRSRSNVPEPPLPQVIVDRKMARQLYDLLGSALGNGAVGRGTR